jgi:hypothetical protein
VTVYGEAGVPVYLLLDMQEESATVFWAPSAKGYTSHTTVPFGKPLHIPAPFDCELDTGGFGAPHGKGRPAQGRGRAARGLLRRAEVGHETHGGAASARRRKQPLRLNSVQGPVSQQPSSRPAR